MRPRKRDDRRYKSAREYRLKRTYGITSAEFDAIQEVQGGMCPLCKHAKGISTPLQVDHDHSLEKRGKATRKSVRGLVCGRCNNRLGWVEAHLEDILAYLDSPPAWKVLNEH